jgi:hypothetical protein
MKSLTEKIYWQARDKVIDKIKINDHVFKQTWYSIRLPVYDQTRVMTVHREIH